VKIKSLNYFTNKEKFFFHTVLRGLLATLYRSNILFSFTEYSAIQVK